MKRFLICCSLLIAFITSCKAPPATDYVLEQSVRDEKEILSYLAAYSLTAKRHQSGLYYIISDPGSTEVIPYSSTTTIAAKYTGRLFINSHTPFATVITPQTSVLGSLIQGWQVGIPLIHKGGKIRLFIPSGMAYGPIGSSGIPPNSILDYDIELVDVHN